MCADNLTVTYSVNTHGAMKRLKLIETKIKERKATALHKIGQWIYTEARNNSPVDTGTLRESITYKTGSDYAKVYVPLSSMAGQYASKMEGKYHYMSDAGKAASDVIRNSVKYIGEGL